MNGAEKKIPENQQDLKFPEMKQYQLNGERII
jgi:hypothetical protein